MLLETLEDNFSTLSGCCGGGRRRRSCSGCRGGNHEPMNKNVNIINVGSPQYQSADRSVFAPENRSFTIAPRSPSTRPAPVLPVVVSNTIPNQPESRVVNLLARAWQNLPEPVVQAPHVQPAQRRVYRGFWPPSEEPRKIAAQRGYWPPRTEPRKVTPERGYWPPQTEPGKGGVYKGFE